MLICICGGPERLRIERDEEEEKEEEEEEEEAKDEIEPASHELSGGPWSQSKWRRRRLRGKSRAGAAAECSLGLLGEGGRNGVSGCGQ